VNRARNECSIAAGVTDPLEITPGEHTPASQQSYFRKTAPERLEHAEIHAAARSDSPQIQQE
jgi:hypothetical protein